MSTPTPPPAPQRSFPWSLLHWTAMTFGVMGYLLMELNWFSYADWRLAAAGLLTLPLALGFWTARMIGTHGRPRLKIAMLLLMFAGVAAWWYFMAISAGAVN